MIGCESKNGHQKGDMCWTDWITCSIFLLTILDAIVNIIGGTYDYLVTQASFHFDNEEDIHSSSKIYEESGYGHDLDLLIILNSLWCVSYPTRSGCRQRSVHLRPTYLNMTFAVIDRNLQIKSDQKCKVEVAKTNTQKSCTISAHWFWACPPP